MRIRRINVRSGYSYHAIKDLALNYFYTPDGYGGICKFEVDWDCDGSYRLYMMGDYFDGEIEDYTMKNCLFLDLISCAKYIGDYNAKT